MKKKDSYRKERRGYINSMDNMRKSTGRYTVILNIIAAIVIIYAVVGTVHMKQQDAEITQNYVKNYTKQISDMIGMEIAHIESNVVSLVEALEKEYVRTELGEFIDRKREIYSFDYMAVCDAQNHIETESGDTEKKAAQMEALMESEPFRAVLDKGECASGIYGDFVFWAKNIYRDGEIAGVFWGADRTEKLRDIFMTRTFQKENSISFIMDKNGRILIASEPEMCDKDVFNILQNKNDISDKKKIMMENIASDKNGIFPFRSVEGRMHYVSYALTAKNNWVTVAIMPARLFTGFTDGYVKMMLGCVLAILVIFSAFLVLLYRSYFQNGRELERLAFRDEVTGGINRTELRMRYQELCREKKADQYTLLLLDCVDFKMINASLGEKNGDRMLKYFYTVIKSCLEKDEIVARTEMDHYYILLKEKNPNVISRRAGEILARIISFENTEVPRCDVAFRMGACPVEDNNPDLTLLQDRVIAVVKNQASKDIGKLIYFDRKLADKIQRERELDSLFDDSIANGDFKVYLQPKVNVHSGVVAGAEALIRWILPEKGIVSPAEFIPLLEKNGKICILDRYVFEEVCSLMKRWKEEGAELFPISVNLSRSHFVNENFLRSYVKIADKYQVDRSLIEFEVTETIFLDASQMKKVREGLQMIHKYGFRCSLDDFGYGYSSLTLLREFEIDVLKLDRSFFMDLDSARARDVIASILDMAEKLNIHTVAEGIETRQQMEYIKTVNCDTIQGYFFSRPLPVEEFETWFREFRIENYI